MKPRVARFIAIRKQANGGIRRGIHTSLRFSVAMKLKAMRRSGRCDGKRGLQIFNGE